LKITIFLLCVLLLVGCTPPNPDAKMPLLATLDLLFGNTSSPVEPNYEGRVPGVNDFHCYGLFNNVQDIF
jgi:hypothetical protein